MLLQCASYVDGIIAWYEPSFRLAMLADGASVGDVCHKLAIRLTIEPDMALAEKLNPARDGWQ